MTTKLRVVLVDDHPLFREGVVYVLSNIHDIEVVGEGSTASEAVELAASQRPDVMLIDLDMPGGGLSAISAIAAASPSTRLAVLTASSDEDMLVSALRLGAHGYILKGIAARDLVSIIRSIALGGGYVAPALAAAYFADLVHSRSPRDRDLADTLTKREHEVLELVSTGASNREIAQQLSLTEKTVKYYMTHILQKLNVRNRVEAAMTIRKNGASQRT